MHQVKINGIVIFLGFLVIVVVAVVVVVVVVVVAVLTAQHPSVPFAIRRKERPSITSLISTIFIATYLRFN